MFGVRISKLGSASKLGLIAKAIGILRSYGADAHVYIPGVGTISGITAGNYLDSAGTTAASVDNPVGLVVDSFGSINATQGTTANKPILRRGTLNLLLQSEDFSSASWTKTAATVTANATTDPLGGSTADKLISTAVANWHTVYQNVIPANTPVRFSVYAKAAEETKVALSDFSGATGCVFDLSAVTATVSGTDAALTISSPSITSVGNGWYRCSVSMLATATKRAAIYVRQFATSFLGDGTSGIYVWGAQLEIGTTASAYSPTTTAAASNPSAGKYWWQFDGSNDSLSLSAPLFQMSDDHCVIAGANCTSVAFDATIADVAGQGTGQRTAAISYTATNGFIKATWSDNTLVPIVISDNVNRVGAATVSTAVKIGNAKRLRVNGVQSGATNNTVMGATTLTGGTIGMNTWGNNFFVGSIYPLIAIKGTVSDAELMVLEKYVGMCCGVSI